MTIKRNRLKVALINPAQQGRYPQPPMGLALLAAVLERGGYQVTVFDANALGLRPEEVAKLAADASVVGLTAMTPTIGAAMTIACCLKEVNPNSTIILGGTHATLLPEETLTTALEIDIVVRGEGEETIIKLLQALEYKEALDSVPGISYRRDGEVITNPPASKDVDMDSLPFLAYHLLCWQRYKPHPPHGRALPFAAIITSRGCPYRCSFCSKSVFGNKFRAQSPERVVEEVDYYKRKLGVREIAFYDDVFTLNKQRAYAIADNIINRGLKLDWTCETRVNLVDKELLRHMKQAGCYAVAYGIESASQDMLDTLDKDITLEQVEEAVRITQEVGLQTIGYFIIGSPGETPDTINKTIKFAKKLKLDAAQFAIAIPFPGTPLYNLYSKGRKDNIPWEHFTYASIGRGVTPVFESDVLSGDALKEWIKKAYKEFYLRPSYIWQRLQRVTSARDLIINVKGLPMLLGNIR